MKRRRQHGLGLVELMITITLGLILVAGVLTLFMATLNSNKDLVGLQQLQNQLHATLGVISRDLRRIGSNGQASAAPDFINPFGLGTLSAYTGEAANSCLLFSYDLNSNGVLDTSSPDERMGYRVRAGVVQQRSGGLDCSADGWEDMTAADTVNITALTFSITTTSVGDMDLQRIDVTLAGTLVHDSTISRSMTRTLRVRNAARSP